MKTANDLSSYVGKVGLLVTKAEGLTIRVRVEDARVAWGAVQVKVTPADGPEDGRGQGDHEDGVQAGSHLGLLVCGKGWGGVMTEKVKAGDLKLGDVVRLFDTGPFGDGVVRQIVHTDKGEFAVHVFRPYATTGDFSYTGGVIPYIGVEEVTLYSETGDVVRMQKGGEKR